VKIHLGDSGFGPVELIYSGDLGSNLLLKRSNLKLSELLGTPGVTIVNGSGVDTLTLTHAITNQPISTVVVSYSLTPGSSDLLTSLTIVLTPSEPTNDPTTHLFVPSTSGAYSGITYTKTKADTIASAGFLSLDPAAPVNNLGLYGAYRIIYPDGRMRELVAAPPVTSGSNLTFTWVPNVSHPNGGSYEGLLHEEVTETSGLSGARPVKIHRYYRQIGDAPSPPPAPPPKIAKVLVLEESVPLGGTEAETRSVIFGYDDRLSVTGKYGLKVDNPNFGRRVWEARNDGTWVLKLIQESLDAVTGEAILAEAVEITPWLDGPANVRPAQFGRYAGIGETSTYMQALIASAMTKSPYMLDGTRRRIDTDKRFQTTGSWTFNTMSEHSIGGRLIGIKLEYLHDATGSLTINVPEHGLASLGLDFKSRQENWTPSLVGAASANTKVNPQEFSAWNWNTPFTWSSTYSRETTGSVSLSQDGIASFSHRPVNTEQHADNMHKLLVVPNGSTKHDYHVPMYYKTLAVHSLSQHLDMDDQMRTITHTSRHQGASGAGYDYQTISTAHTGETAYTRSTGAQVLDSQLEDTIIIEGTVQVRTSSRTDAQGITTVAKTNEATGELISETKMGVDATAEFPAQPSVITAYAKSTNATTGEVTQTVTQTAGAATRTLSITVTDALGRTKSVTDEMGRVTAYDYSADGRTTTETLPGGLTRITTTYLDGQLKSITGTAAVPEFHDYMVNDGSNAAYEAGSITETVWTGWDGNGNAPAEALWRKTTSNFLKQVLREESPSPALSGGVVAVTHFYNAKGQKVKSQTTGQAAMLFAYDDWGNLQRQGYDLNEDGAFTQNSPDVVSEQTLSYEMAGDAVFEVTTENIWGRAGSTATTRRDLRDAIGNWQERTNGNGSYQAFKTESDPMAQMRWEASGPSLDENWKSSARTFYNGQLMREVLNGRRRTYQYDGFGSVTQVVETTLAPATAGNPVQTTTTVLGHTGGLLASESISGTGTRTFSRDARTYSYYPADHVNAGQVKTITQGGHVTRLAYDALGRQTHQWGDAAQPQRYEYDSTGRLWKLHTYQGGTGWNSESLPEDVFNTATAATTTWAYRPGTNALWKKTDALNRSVTYAYDASGILLSKTNARGTAATYSYEQTPSGKKIPGRVSGITYDDGSTPPVSFIYHTDGSLKTVTDAAGTQGINLSGSSVLARNIVISGDGLLNGVILNRTHLDEDHPQTLQLRLASEPILPDAGGSLSYNNPVTLFTHAYGWYMGKYPRLMGVGSTAGTGLTAAPSTSVSYSYVNGLVRHRYLQGLNYQTSYRYMPDGAVMEIATQTRRYSYSGKMVGRGGMADEWYYEFDSRGRRQNMLWTDKYEPDFQDRHPKRWIYDYNERGEVEQADREGQFLTENGWETASVTHQRRSYTFDLMGNRDIATQGTSAAEKAAFTQDYTPNLLQQYSTVARGRVVEITGEAAQGAVVALRIDDGTSFTVDRSLPQNQTGDYNSFRYLHTVTGPQAAAAQWVKVEFTATLGTATTLRRGFVYVPPADEAPQHDLDGNLIEDGRWVYTWDAENRLTSVTQKVLPVAAGASTPPARTKLEFAYDYKNRRIAKKVFVEESGTGLQPVSWRLTKDLRFVYDGWHMIAELDATFATGTGVAGITPTRGVVRTYLWGPDVSGTMTGAGGVGGLLAFTFQGDSYYPISNANGNITAIHAPGIDQVIRFDYDPFGNRITNTGPDVEICPMGVSSKYTDSETGLVNFGLRVYSPQLGRWPSRDPIGDLQFYRAFIAGRSDEEMDKWREAYFHSQYSFVLNDPINTFDLLGLVDREFFKPNSWEETDQSFYDDGSDVYDIGAHGNPSSIFDQNTGRSLSAQQLYDLIKNDALFKSAQKIKLWACSTGQGDGSFAQQLATLSCKKVVAPTDILWAGVLNDGKAHVDPPKDRNDPNSPRTGNPIRRLLQGRWKTFKPKN
jgi:RHS repeat-associated protein